MSVEATEAVAMQREAARRWVDDMVHNIRLTPAWLIAQVGWTPQPQFHVWTVSGLAIWGGGIDDGQPRLEVKAVGTVSGRVCDELARRIRFECPMSSVITGRDMSVSLGGLVDTAIARDESFFAQFPLYTNDDGFYSGPVTGLRFIAHIDIIRFFH